jgi:hypothetical protein
MHHQQHQVGLKVRPLMEQQGTLINISTPRGPAGDSFNYSDDQYCRITKRFKNNKNSSGTQFQPQYPENTHFSAHHSFNPTKNLAHLANRF